MLETYGVPTQVEEAYFILQHHGPLDRDGLRVWLRQTPGIDEVLEGLERFGLASETPGKRWEAVDVDVALDHLDQRLNAAREAARKEVRETVQSAAHYETGTIEMLRGHDAIREKTWERLQAATESLEGFDLPPYMDDRGEEATSADGLREIAPEWSVLDQQKELRSIYDPRGFLNNDTKIREISVWIEHGEKARTASLNTKLMIVDHREAFIGMLATYGGPPEDVRSIYTDHPIILEALKAQFQTTWDHATPWPTPSAPGSAEDRRQRVMQCLMAGMGVDQIARQLNVKPRTVYRDKEKLRSDLDVGDDVQLGMRLREMRDGIVTPPLP